MKYCRLNGNFSPPYKKSNRYEICLEDFYEKNTDRNRFMRIAVRTRFLFKKCAKDERQANDRRGKKHVAR